MRDAIVSGNFITKCDSYAIQIFGVADSMFKNNFLYEPNTVGLAAVRIYDGGVACNSNVLFEGNSILDNSPVISASGFIIETANPKALRFVNNNIQGPPILYDNTAGAGDEVSIVGIPRNYSFLFDCPSVAAGGQFTTNFPATGTRTNDLVKVMFPSQFYNSGSATNVAVDCWGSTDTINLRVINQTPAGHCQRQERCRAAQWRAAPVAVASSHPRWRL